MKQAVQFVLRIYKRIISPMLPHSCRFVPTCSEYAMEAVELHGAARGSLLAIARLLRCHPFARPGFDPPPRPDGLHSRQTVVAEPAAKQSAEGPASGVTWLPNSHSRTRDTLLGRLAAPRPSRYC